VNQDQALARNVGTCHCDGCSCLVHDDKGKIQVGGPGKVRWTEARHKGRAARSSAEGFVIGDEMLIAKALRHSIKRGI